MFVVRAVNPQIAGVRHHTIEVRMPLFGKRFKLRTTVSVDTASHCVQTACRLPGIRDGLINLSQESAPLFLPNSIGIN